jgi:hypothetical protein
MSLTVMSLKLHFWKSMISLLASDMLVTLLVFVCVRRLVRLVMCR